MRILFILLIVTFLSCKSNKLTSLAKNNYPPITFTELSTGENSGFTEKIAIKIASLESLSENWNIAFSNYLNKKNVPAINFKEQTVILVALGEKSNGGFAINIESITENNENIIVKFTETIPGETCMTTSVITYPYQIVKMPKSDKKVKFISTQKIYECEK